MAPSEVQEYLGAVGLKSMEVTRAIGRHRRIAADVSEEDGAILMMILLVENCSDRWREERRSALSDECSALDAIGFLLFSSAQSIDECSANAVITITANNASKKNPVGCMQY